MKIKPKYLGVRVSFVTSKGKPLDVTLLEKTPKTVIKEIAKKWPNWVEETPTNEKSNKEEKTAKQDNTNTGEEQ